MDNLNLHNHISGQFNAELAHIRTQVMSMGGLVEQQLTDAITAMLNQDSQQALRVIDGDKEVNLLEVSIDEACVRIIARRQPAAGDLRLIMAIIKTTSELERIGDVADKICRTALESFTQQHRPLIVSLESLGRHAIQMLHDVLDAFARMDIEDAIRIYHEDQKIDREYESIVRELMTYMMEDPRTIPNVLTALFCARSIERIGDRCQNICEFIFYFVKGHELRRDKISIGMIFLTPLFQLIILGYAVNMDPHRVPTALLNYDTGRFSQVFISATQNTDYFSMIPFSSEPEAKKAFINGDVIFILTIPEGFSERILKGEKPKLLIQGDAIDPMAIGNALSAIVQVSKNAFQHAAV